LPDFSFSEAGGLTGSKLLGAADLSVGDADLNLLDAYLLSDQSRHAKRKSGSATPASVRYIAVKK